MPRRRQSASGISADGGAGAAVEREREAGAQLRESVDGLFSQSYRELCRVAASIRRADAHATISTSTLVHETWMRLARSTSLKPTEELHLKHIVAKAMRHYVVESARRRGALKRGGGMLITLNESMDLPVSSDREFLALDDALAELARTNTRQAQLVELRFFAGSGVAEAAKILGVSEETARRDFRSAKAWLASQIRRSQ